MREVKIPWFVGTCKGRVILYNNFLEVFACFIIFLFLMIDYGPLCTNINYIYQ